MMASLGKLKRSEKSPFHETHNLKFWGFQKMAPNPRFHSTRSCVRIHTCHTGRHCFKFSSGQDLVSTVGSILVTDGIDGTVMGMVPPTY